MKNTNDAADAFQFFLADIRSHGVPSVVECVRFDNGGEFSEGSFKLLGAERGIRHEFTTPDTPKFNGMVERGLGIVQEAAHAACLEAPRLFPDVQLPSTGRLWTEACFWACERLNRSATTANPGNCSPHELFFGVTPKLRMLPFLRPGYCRVRRDNKAEPKAQRCFYLSGGSKHPADSLKVVLPSGAITYTRDLAWEHSRAAPFVPAPAGGGREQHLVHPLPPQKPSPPTSLPSSPPPPQ